MAKTFTKFGLKRDNNLADIPNKEQALNNLLKDIKGNKPAFTVEDLECIKELFPKGVQNGDFLKLGGIAVKFLSPDAENDVLTSFDPLITLENRFDRAYFTVSDPFFYGGEGPTARYFDNDQITRAVASDPTSNFTGFTGDPVTTNNKWENGRFAYTNKITSEFISLYGAVQWSGYFKPVISGNHSFDIVTTGFYKFEFDDGNNNYDFTFDAVTGTFNYNNSNFNSGLITFRDETKINSDFNIISIDENNTSSTLSNKIGDARSRRIIIPFPLSEWTAYKIRVTFFIDEISIENPEENLYSIQKLFDIDVNDPQGSTNDILNFKQLYEENYFTNYIVGDFKDYVDKSVYFGGTNIGDRRTIGSTSTTPGQNYRNLSSLGPVTTFYTPPKVTANILNVKTQCRYASNNDIVIFNNSSDANRTEGIEVGNYVIGNGIQANTRVKEIIINNSVILDKRPVSSIASGSLTFVNHRGFVGTGTCNTTSGSNTLSSVANLTNSSEVTPGLVIVSDGYTGSDFVRIISYSGSTMTLTRNMNSNLTGTRFYVYYDTGLVDQSLKTFCQDVVARRIIQPQGQPANTDYTYNPNSTVITLDSVSGLTNGMFVHLYPAVPYQIVNVNGVEEIRSLASITNVNATNNTITISQGILSSITYTPNTITRLTITPVGVNVNKEVCFTPTDTSPPFSASSEGLSTSQNVSLVSSYGGSANTNSEVVYNNLFVSCKTSEVKTWAVSDTVTHVMPIVDRNGVTYNLLLGS